MRKFLICSTDVSVVEHPPMAVVAESADAALEKYLRCVWSKDRIFREHVLDLSINMSFLERFYLATDKEQARFDEDHSSGTELEIVVSRIKTYFSAKPEAGELFIRYMETKDASLIGDEVYEFIAVSEKQRDHGLMALDPELVQVLMD